MTNIKFRLPFFWLTIFLMAPPSQSLHNILLRFERQILIFVIIFMNKRACRWALYVT
jgi:hypothetical protein